MVDYCPLTCSYNLVSEFFVLVTKKVLKSESIQLLLGDKTKDIQPNATLRTRSCWRNWAHPHSWKVSSYNLQSNNQINTNMTFLEKKRRLSPIQALHSVEKVMQVTGPLPTFTACLHTKTQYLPARYTILQVKFVNNHINHHALWNRNRRNTICVI